MVLKRVIAYFIDILIVTFASSMLASISYLNPQLKKYEKIYEAYVEEYEKLDLKDVNREELADINYQLDRSNIYGAVISITLTIIYFVVFQKYNNGQTLGKKLMGIKIDGDLSLFKYFIRSLILYNLFINIAKVILILNISKEKYIKLNDTLFIIALIIEVGIFIMVTMREDKRGLHDIIVDSNVVSIERKKQECITNS